MEYCSSHARRSWERNVCFNQPLFGNARCNVTDHSLAWVLLENVRFVSLRYKCKRCELERKITFNCTHYILFGWKCSNIYYNASDFLFFLNQWIAFFFCLRFSRTTLVNKYFHWVINNNRKVLRRKVFIYTQAKIKRFIGFAFHEALK